MTTLAERTAVPESAGDEERSLYLTDGLRLFRVVRGETWPPEASYAVLEDCRTLEGRPYTVEELATMSLRIVETPEPDDDRRQRLSAP